MQHLYPPDCGSPFFPFGYCACTLAVVGSAQQEVAACNASELQLGDGDGTGGNVTTTVSQVAVVQGDKITYTGFSDYTEVGDDPGYSYNHTFSVAGERVVVTLDLFFGKTVEAEVFVTHGTVDPDYNEDDGFAAKKDVTGGAGPASPVRACYDEFFARNDGSFGQDEGDYYSVYYNKGYSGCNGNFAYTAPTYEVTVFEKDIDSNVDE